MNDPSRRSFFVLVFLLLLSSFCAAQTKPHPKPAPKSTDTPSPSPAQDKWSELNQKYPGLVDEFGVLYQKLQQGVTFPPARSQSRLLPLLPAGTIAYAAAPNYGDALRQALAIFRGELKQSAALRDWWQHGEPATSGPKFEAALEKFSQLSDYLGEEVVISAEMDPKQPRFLALAAVRKPGLRPLLQDLLSQLSESSKDKPNLRIVDPQELAADPALKVRPCAQTDKTKCTPEERRASEQLLVLVRPDYVLAASDADTLRSFNTRLDRGPGDFASSDFGKRLLQAYGGGAELLAAADLRAIISQIPFPQPKDRATFERTGFADLKYLVWETRHATGQFTSESELSFGAPRHGIASWLAEPAPLGSLEFVPPSAMMVSALMLKSPVEIFDDVRDLSTASDPKGFAKLDQYEQALNLNLRNDLLRHLGGEITFELDDVTPTQAVWRAVLGVKDPVRLQQGITTLLQAMLNVSPQIKQEDGVTYYVLRAPSGKTTTEFAYAFEDGYLVAGPGRATVADAIHLHRTGAGLAKSQRYRDALPPGHSPEASAVFFRDPVAMAAVQLRTLGPAYSNPLAQFMGQGAPAVLSAYADSNTIRGASTSGTSDAGVAAIIAAIAIPNLLRSRMAANEASAVASLRTVITAQVTYAAAYPERGFAGTLEALGPDPKGRSGYSPDHAGLVDASVGCADMWCTKDGFRFTITAACRQQNCHDYVAIATPLSADAGARNFCSTNDGVIRFKAGPPLASPVSAATCRSWAPLQ